MRGGCAGSLRKYLDCQFRWLSDAVAGSGNAHGGAHLWRSRLEQQDVSRKHRDDAIEPFLYQQISKIEKKDFLSRVCQFLCLIELPCSFSPYVCLCSQQPC